MKAFFDYIIQEWGVISKALGIFILALVLWVIFIAFLLDRHFKDRLETYKERIETYKVITDRQDRYIKELEREKEQIEDQHKKEIQEVEANYIGEIQEKDGRILEVENTLSSKSKDHDGFKATVNSFVENAIQDYKLRLSFLVKTSRYFDLSIDEIEEKTLGLVAQIREFSDKQNRELQKLPVNNDPFGLRSSLPGYPPTKEDLIRQQYRNIANSIEQEYYRRFKTEAILVRESLIEKIKDNKNINCRIDPPAISFPKFASSFLGLAETIGIRRAEVYKTVNSPEALNAIANELESLTKKLTG